MTRRMVQRRRMPSPDHNKLENRCGDRGEQPWSLPGCIQATAGDTQRKHGRGHGNHAHVHQHVRKERLARELRQRPQPDDSQYQQSAGYDTAAHQ